MEEISGGTSKVPQRPVIPNKLFFRIGEVSQLLGLEPHVVRYWETEFPGVTPKKSSSGQRMFRRKDVEMLLEIKHLLYDKKFTLEGARLALQERGKPNVVSRITARHSAGDVSALPQIRSELAEILKILS